MRTSGNTILITGGTSGIGRAFAEEFIRLGNTVIVCGRRAERLQKLQEKFPGLITYHSDIAGADERRTLAEWTLANFPEINILINNAGIQLTADLTRPVDIDRIESEVQTNFIAPVHLGSLLVPHLSKKEQSAIINISSGLAFVPIAFMPVYCATKAAMHSLTLSLRYQLKNTTVKVFEIIPPSVDTELGQERRKNKNETHGGMPVEDFIRGAIDAIENDQLEAPVAEAKNLYHKREAMFPVLNR